MARGWESKSVEAQQEEARQQKPQRRKLTAEEARKERQKQGLNLSRQRILQQLAVTHNPRHRKLLEDALAALDQKLGSA